MFRAELNRFEDESLLKMEGRFAGHWADQVRALLSQVPVPKALIVDLTGVSYIDAAGERMLAWLSTMGARFVAKAAYTAAICKRLNFVLHTKPVWRKPTFRGVLVAHKR